MINKIDLYERLLNGKKNDSIVWICNIGEENESNNKLLRVNDYGKKNIVNGIEEINILLCRKIDILILRKMPDETYLKYLKTLNFDIPKILVPKNIDETLSITELVSRDERILDYLKKMSSKKNVFLMPFMINKEVVKLSKRVGISIIGSDEHIIDKIDSKFFCRKLVNKCKYNITEGEFCNGYEEFEKYRDILLKEDYDGKIVMKSEYGSSGQGMFLINNYKIINKLIWEKLFFNNSILVEKWIENKKDFSVQIFIDHNGDSFIFSIKEQMMEETVYIGSVEDDMEECNTKKKLKQMLELLIKDIIKEGFWGWMSIDSMAADGKIYPAIEINGRMTLTSYISLLNKKWPGKVIISKYIDVITNEKITFLQIHNILKKEKLEFRDNRDGVFVYNSSTISEYCNLDRRYYGRIFVLSIASKRKISFENLERFEDIIKNLDY